MSKTAILNVDCQNCFGHPEGSLYVKGGEWVVRPTNRVVAHGRSKGLVIIWSGDQHPPKTKHFKEFGGPWPVHGVRGTWGAQFLADLDIRPGDAFIAKAMREDEDGYSPLCGNAFMHDGRTAVQFLEDEGIDVLVIAGLATDYCVKAAVLDARKLGKKVYVVTDAIRAVNFFTPEDGQKALDAMTAAGAILITSEQFLQL